MNFKKILTYLFKMIEIVTYPFKRIMTYLFKKNRDSDLSYY